MTRKDIEDLRAKGWTYKRIGEKFGYTMSYIHWVNTHQNALRQRYCLICNKEVRKQTKYCLECLPGYLQYGTGRTRELVRVRDQHTCQGCKKVWRKGERRFDIHHLNGLCGKMSMKYDRQENMSGLITLCHKCHYNRHDFNPD